MFGFFTRKPTQTRNLPSEVELKDRGNQLLAKGQLREAEACYRQAIAANADFAIGYLNLGFVLNEQGRCDEAERILDRAVSLDPAQGDAWYVLGRIAQARGLRQVAIEKFRQALEASPRLDVASRDLSQVLFEDERYEDAKQVLTKAIAINSRCAKLNLSLGILLARELAWDEAAECFRKEVQIQPDSAEAHFRLGDALQIKGAFAEAVISYRAALSFVPDWADAHRNLGNVLKAQGESALAIQCYRRAIELAPEVASVHNNLGIALQEQGEIDAAIESYHRALSLEPEDANVLCNLGAAFHLRGRHERAIEYFSRALACNPDCARAHQNMGSVLLKQGDLNAAIACYGEALRIDPENGDAYLNLGNAYDILGKPDAAIQSFRRAMAIDPESPVARYAQNNLIVARSAFDASSSTEYLLEARHFGEKALAWAKPYVHRPTGHARQAMRIGFVSGDFRQHPVGFFLENVLTHLSSRHVGLIAYSTIVKEDALTARLKPQFSEWNVIANLSDQFAAKKINDDQIDILVDLAGHTADNRLALFAWKPAPVQVSWLGYWASTGMPGIDYFLADPVSLPAGRSADFTEAIWYLPDTRLCFTPPRESAGLAVTPPPAMRNGYVTFACFQNLGKLSDASLALWGKILCAQPNARLRLQDRHLGYPAARAQLQRRLSDVGIPPARVTMHGRMPREDYLAAYADVDIVLDTFPFSGGTTTCEALWMGVPTLTIAGQTLISRQGASMLSCVGLEDWVTHDEEAYVAKALAHAADLQGLAALRTSLRQRALDSPLFDAGRFAGHLEEALQGMWQRYVAGTFT